ncbi:hypothetical protein HBI71_174020 [Parastagonospora nodorum]|nr:hypothetical protein HBI71_174020 [Parastagonospora nodorum]
MISSNSMLQTNIREGYRITTLEVVELIEDLISYYSAKVKIEDLSNTLTLILSKTAQRRSLSIMSNRSTALITNKFSVTLLTKLAILNDANIALIIDALTMTLIKDNDDLLSTVNSYIKLRRLRARYKTEAADSRYAKVSRRRTKKDKDLENSNTSSDQLEKEAQLKKTRDEEKLAKLDSLLDSDDYRLDSSSDINPKDNLEDEEATTAKDLLTDAYILYFKELLSNNSRIFANAISIGKTRAIVLAYNLSNLLALQFCFFSNSLLENISRLTKEEVIEMRINTTNAISKALAAANKLVALQSYVLGGFIIVCSFGKVDKHMFRAYNTISVTAQRTIIRKGSSYIEKRAILLLNILEKEGLNKLEASRRVIFNCFEMQAIFKTYGSCKVKRFTLNSVKNLFTNLSKNYFLLGLREKFSNESILVMQRGITQHEINLKLIIVALIAFAEAIILTEATHVVIIEPQDSIVYFNLDSELELKVLGKQDVKTTS